jgi:dolichol-phosphate mannosyltransferase/undecaprenyl-phosphate 4-deoxy-4-formamido-L-arabinose transferase
MRNFGQHSALICGFRFCRGHYVITLDDDLQHPPEEIPKLIECMKTQDCDAVIARYQKKQHAFYRNLGTRVLRWFTKSTLGIPKHLDLTSFRLMKRAAVDALLEFRVASPRVGLMLCSVTKNLVNVETRHESRKVGRSGYSLRRLVSFMIDNTLSYSSLPLKMTSWLGFSSAGLSFVVAVYFLTKYLAGGTSVSGFTTIVLLVTFFSGAILMTLGIVGEYLVRIIRAAEMKPLYVIAEVCEQTSVAKASGQASASLESVERSLQHGT